MKRTDLTKGKIIQVRITEAMHDQIHKLGLHVSEIVRAELQRQIAKHSKRA